MLSFFEAQKKHITSFLASAFGRESEILGEVNTYSGEVRERLLRYTLQGKMIRGGLVRLGHDLFSGDNDQQVTAIGAALELFQSGLLIHDDIMDRDEKRRGGSTLHHQYFADAEAGGLADARHVGNALGICVGDIAFFLGFQILAGLQIDSTLHKKLFAHLAREMSYVGTAQMQDVVWGAGNPHNRPVTEEAVLSLYRYKTGRYTFSLPLSAGALVARAPAEALSALESLGENLGVIFQIKDDELGLFGEEQELGKPLGSDIREGKKTVFFARLVGKLGEKEKERFFSVYGNPGISAPDVTYVRDLLTLHGVRKDIGGLVDSLAARCRKTIESLSAVHDEKKEILFRLLDYSLSRRS